MNRLLYKELRLCLTPQMPLFLAFALMLLIPNYPYLVAGFFVCNAVFFSFTQAVADNDLLFTVMLPVSKAEAVRGKLRFVVLYQLAALLLYVPMIFINHALHPAGNAAGTDAGLTLLAGMLAVFAVFNAAFLPRFYGAAHRFGRHFLYAAVAVFGFITLFEGFMIVCAAARSRLPLFEWVETHLDCFPASAEAWTVQLAALAAGAAVYAGLNALTCRRTVARFDRGDL